MSTLTSNLGLIKPALTDQPDITAINPNWDTVDQALAISKVATTTYTNASATDDYTITIPEIESQTELLGVPIKFKTTVVNTGACTLNINGYGAKSICKDTNVALETGDIIANAIVGVVWDGSQYQIIEMNGTVTKNGTQTLTNKTLTAPKVGSAGYIADANGNEIFKTVATVTSAVNEVTVKNAATGSAPGFNATGDDANIDFNISPKGTGAFKVSGRTAEGLVTIASGSNSHAEGWTTSAIGNCSHAEGYGTVAGVTGSTATNDLNMNGEFTHAEGCGAFANGFVSHAEGYGTVAGPSGTAKKSPAAGAGYFTHAEGNGTTASGNSAHAEGVSSLASGISSHAEGDSTKATAYCTHTEGVQTVASSNNAHAEGSNSKAYGATSHVEGYYSIAGGDTSHAEGGFTLTSIDCHAEGLGSVASNGLTYTVIAYNGTSKTFTLDTITGLTVGTKVDIVMGIQEQICQTSITAINSLTITVDTTITISTVPKYVIKRDVQGYPCHSEGCATVASGLASHSEGEGTLASGYDSHAEGYGTTSSGTRSHAEGEVSKAEGVASHAEGSYCDAAGSCSHAEGYHATANAAYSHAEGYQCTTLANASHAEGTNCYTNGASSHAGGESSGANGYCSFAHGSAVIASGSSQAVFGKFNATSASDLFQVGYGTSESDRKNAFAVTADGFISSTLFEVNCITAPSYQSIKSATQDYWDTIIRGRNGKFSVLFNINNGVLFMVDIFSAGGTYGSCIIQSYSLSAPYYGIKDNSTWVWKTMSVY